MPAPSAEDAPQEQPSRSKRRRRISLSPLTFILLLTTNLLTLMVLAWPLARARLDALGKASPTPTTTAQLPRSQVTAESNVPDAAQSAASASEERGVLILAVQEGLDTHLFAYRPIADDGDAPLVRLTSGPGRDLTPALSPDGDTLAYASNRTGEWQIQLWDLNTNRLTTLTDNPTFKASPTWSPDGLWLAYEGYYDNSLDIFIQAADGNGDPLRLTDSSAADHSPAWSPGGRQIAFISTRGGGEDVWLADLDKSGEDRFTRLENPGQARALHPVWSPDGRYLAWGAVMRDGFHKIFLWDSQQSDQPPREMVSGDYFAWGQDGETLYAALETPFETYLSAYPATDPSALLLPPLPLPGRLEGMIWVPQAIGARLRTQSAPAPTPLWDVEALAGARTPGVRWGLAELEDIEAPYPQLHDQVDEAFAALRQTVARQAGWDALATLENAYVPLTIPLPPGYEQDWLYTGRAFAVSPLPIHAGWMAVVREDYGPETYWRIYLRARFQDGSQGTPLHNLPWDFNARFQAEPRPYEQGGQPAADVPSGYWVDLTRIAALYGWQRLPAFSNWRSVYSAARFNEFVITGGLDWQSAMLEIYPRQVLITPTPIPTFTPPPTPTATPTPTPTGQVSPTPSITPSPTATLTLTPPP